MDPIWPDSLKLSIFVTRPIFSLTNGNCIEFCWLLYLEHVFAFRPAEWCHWTWCGQASCPLNGQRCGQHQWIEEKARQARSSDGAAGETCTSLLCSGHQRSWSTRARGRRPNNMAAVSYNIALNMPGFLGWGEVLKHFLFTCCDNEFRHNAKFVSGCFRLKSLRNAFFAHFLYTLVRSRNTATRYSPNSITLTSWRQILSFHVLSTFNFHCISIDSTRNRCSTCYAQVVANSR